MLNCLTLGTIYFISLRQIAIITFSFQSYSWETPNILVMLFVNPKWQKEHGDLCL